MILVGALRQTVGAYFSLFPRPELGYTGAVNSIDPLLSIVDRFRKTKVLLLGDLVLDRFILGTPKRISREAPVIILRHEGQEDIPGGGANSLANLASLGVHLLPIGFVGDDEAGKALTSGLQSRGIDTHAISKIPGFRTPMKVRILGGGASSLKHQIARYDIEDTLNLDAAQTRRLHKFLAQSIPDSGALALSDYGYGAIPQGLLEDLDYQSPQWTLLDSRRRIGGFRGIDGATPNLGELEDWAGEKLKCDEAVVEAAEALRAHLDCRFILATRGNQGMTLVEEGMSPIHLSVFGTDEVADVTGAGDTVLATLSAALAAGATASQAAHLANIAGGLVVMKLGTATISAEELRQGIRVWGKVS